MKHRHQKAFVGGLVGHKAELLQYMTEEWDAMQKQAKKEELVRRAKEVGYKTGEVLLQFLAIGGGCFIAAVAPNVFVVFDAMKRRKYFANEKNVKRDIYYCKRQGYLEFEKVGEGEYEARITDRGLQKVLQKGFEAIKQRNAEWDGWWRIVMFDIPETKKSERDIFREKLKHLGFYQIQKSVFISPYSCDKELDFLLSVLAVRDYVTWLKAKDMEREEELRKYFRL